MGCINKHRCNTCPKPCQVEIQHHRLDEWFTSVSVANREKITGINYPDCTNYWNNLSRQEKVDMILAKKNSQTLKGLTEQALKTINY